MANLHFESNVPSADDDALFRKSLEAMIPQTAPVSIGQTFYQAGYAAAMAQTRSTSVPSFRKQSQSSWRWASVLAAGLLMGIVGYAFGISKPNAIAIAERTEVVHSDPESRSSIDEIKSEKQVTPGNDETPGSVSETDRAPAWNESLPFLAYLLPAPNRPLSIGSLPPLETQDSAVALAHPPASLSRVALTSHPVASQDILNALLAP